MCRFLLPPLYSTKKASDLEKHLLGVHFLLFKDHALHCTHCESIFLDRNRANKHMKGCSNLKRWGPESRGKYPIHQEFLDEFSYWTSDQVVLSKIPKQKVIWTGTDAAKAKRSKDIISGIGAAGDAFKKPSEPVSAVPCDDIEMTFTTDIFEIVFPVYDVDEVTSVVIKGTPVVIKREEVDEDYLEKTLAIGGEEPVFVVKTVVNSISKDYLLSLIKGTSKLSDLDDGMKDAVILGLCAELAIHKSTLERAAYIHQWRNSPSTANNTEYTAIMDTLEKKQAEDFAKYLTKQEADQHLQQVLVDKNSAVNNESAQECVKKMNACQSDTSAVKPYIIDVKEFEAEKEQVVELTKQLATSMKGGEDKCETLNHNLKTLKSKVGDQRYELKKSKRKLNEALGKEETNVDYNLEQPILSNCVFIFFFFCVGLFVALHILPSVEVSNKLGGGRLHTRRERLRRERASHFTGT